MVLVTGIKDVDVWVLCLYLVLVLIVVDGAVLTVTLVTTLVIDTVDDSVMTRGSVTVTRDCTVILTGTLDVIVTLFLLTTLFDFVTVIGTRTDSVIREVVVCNLFLVIVVDTVSSRVSVAVRLLKCLSVVVIVFKAVDTDETVVEVTETIGIRFRTVVVTGEFTVSLIVTVS